MHLAVLFENIGGYHAARLRAAHAACLARGWRLTAIEITSARAEHQWGDLDAPFPFPVETLLPLEPSTTFTAGGRKTAAAKLPALLSRLAPDSVAIPGWGFPYSRAALSWCRRTGARAILMSESKADDAPRSRWREWLKSILYVRHFDAALVGARSHAAYLRNLGMPAARIFTGYDVVDNDHFARTAATARTDPAAARERQPSIPPRPFFLAVTRFLPRKNVLRLVDAYAAYRAADPHPWDLVLCGSGPEETAIRSRRSLGVHLPGFIHYRDIGDWYGLAGAFIHPALQEQWGLVVNEAMAAGLPVLVSNRCGCYPELIIEDSTGLGFDPEDTAQITALMRRVADPAFDRLALGQAAATHLRQFTPDHFGRGLADAVLAGKDRP